VVPLAEQQRHMARVMAVVVAAEGNDLMPCPRDFVGVPSQVRECSKG